MGLILKKFISCLSFLVLILGGCNPETEEASRSKSSHQAKYEWTDLLGPEHAPNWVSVGSDGLNPEWTIRDGILSLKKAGGGDITNGVSYENFELRLDWKISEGGNSGIFYMANPDTDNVAVWTSALEMQILDDINHSDNKTAFTRAGSVYGLYPTRDGIAKPFGAWNNARIIVNNGQVQHWLNGEKVITFDLNSDDFKDRVARSKFNDFSEVFAKSSRGLIVLQDHQDPVSFRNIHIRELN